MLGLRFLGIRSRLLLLLVLAGLAGAFSLVPLLPSDQLAAAYPRMAVVVGGAALLAAFLGRGLTRPLEELRKILLGVEKDSAEMAVEVRKAFDCKSFIDTTPKDFQHTIDMLG